MAIPAFVDVVMTKVLGDSWLELKRMKKRQLLQQFIQLGKCIDVLSWYTSPRCADPPRLSGMSIAHRLFRAVLLPPLRIDRVLGPDDLAVPDDPDEERVARCRGAQWQHGARLQGLWGSFLPRSSHLPLRGTPSVSLQRGDILFLDNNKRPYQTGDIVVFNIDGRSIPIVHRAIKVFERRALPDEINVLTKGDNNWADDIGLYAPGQRWLEKQHILGRVVGYLPFLGMITIIMNDYPLVKALLIGTLGLVVLTSKE